MRPNVLFITVDQWRGDCLSALGHPVVQTPHLDALAAKGVLFENHYAQCAPCGPSRASIHTGLYMHSHRSVDNGTPLSYEFTNMALEARAFGYAPVLFGYTDTTLDPRLLQPGDTALGSYESVLPGYTAALHVQTEQQQWVDWLTELGYDTSVGRMELHHPGGQRFGPPVYAADHTDAAFTTNQIIEHLEQADSGWFVHASYLSPHAPFVVPEPYNSMFDPADMPPPIRRDNIDDETAIHGLLRGFIQSGQGADADPAAIARWKAVYFAMMAETDHQLGRLLAEVDLAETIVMFTSDHGEMLGDHWLSGKLGFHPESYRVPLIVAGPSLAAAGTRVSHFTESIDLFPTIMEMVEADAPAQCQGESLVPFLAGATPEKWRDAAHWEWDFRNYGRSGSDPETFNLGVIHDSDGTYVHFAGGRPLFFDLTEDPNHFTDFSTDPTRADLVLSYAQRLLTWRLRSDAGDLVNLNATTSPIDS